MPYASTTSVPVGRSRAELEKLLKRFGADAFAYFNEGPRHRVQFRIEGQMIRTDLYTEEEAQKERAAWRALVLVVKAKLVAIESGITTIEREFLADVLLPSGKTISEAVAPQIAAAMDGKEIRLIEGAG